MPAARRLSSALVVSLLALGLAGPLGLAAPATAKTKQTEKKDRQGAGDFAAFVRDLWPDAKAAGISRETFEAALNGVQPDKKVIALTKKQSEFSRPIWEYVNGSVSSQRLARASQASAQWNSTLSAIEARYGVPREVILAVWGMESGFGANTGSMYVVRSLAFVRYRDDFFRGELIQALRILQDGHVERAAMKGSWAGAMGQTQFMPSSYMAFAVDYDGDGHPNIWTSAPDALASTANYLRQKGWQPGLPWLVEVALPGTLDLRVVRRGFADWARLGVRRVDGRELPRSGNANLFLPTGVKGPAFLVGDNFEVIRAYNSSDAYAMGVGYLANRIAGGGPFVRPWPTSEPALTHKEKEEVQRRLSRLGLYKGEADGRHGTKTRDALREFQARTGLTPDGYADAAVLKALRGERTLARNP